MQHEQHQTSYTSEHPSPHPQHTKL